jgi:peptide/nickel transport system permease protein
MIFLFARRLVYSLVVLLGTITVIFFLTRAIPADPVLALMGEFSSPEQIADMRERWGLDKPLFTQYGLYLKQLVVEHDLGVSFHSHRPVITDIKDYLPASLELAILGVLVAYPLGILLGGIAAVRKGRPADEIVRIASLLGASAPLFWTAILLQVVAAKTNWLPLIGRLDLGVTRPTHVTGSYLLDALLTANWSALGSGMFHILLPVITIVLFQTAISTRMTRAGMLEVLGQDYIRTARAKGLPERVVIMKHALKNGAISLITLWAIEAPKVVATMVVVEAVFAWPGIGRYFVESVIYMDYPAIMGATLAIAVIVILFNVAADLLYTFVDPRIAHD